ncbi:MAG: hypothetical protein QM302_07890 [Acidobacteriota bacterium]|nr:hypothetical protein [Acidobacteriota bacterium]
MNYIDMMKRSVESYSHGAVSLVAVPEELRVSRSGVAALSYDMHDRIAHNNSARSASVRNAARTSTR